MDDALKEWMLGSLDIKRIDVTRILTNWDALWRLLNSNFNKDTFIYFTRNDENQEIFAELGRLACIRRNEWSEWMEGGMICFRKNHMLLATSIQTGKRGKTKMRNRKFVSVHIHTLT